MKLTLVLLTRNEIAGVRALLDSIPIHAVDEMFAVDGGSTDGTVEEFRKHGVRVVNQQSKGRGEAFRIAMAEATGDAVIFFSPDGNEDPKDIPRFRPLLEEGFDLVIASRMMRGAHNEEDEQRLKWRKWANNVFNLLANLAFRRQGPFITDSINGFRAVRKDVFERLQLEGTGFTIEYQMTMRALRQKVRIVEFPTHELNRIGGKSGAKAIPTGLRFVKVFLEEVKIALVG
jgi:glycosyltransferase involved in cell wall biosynthesis